MQKQKLLRTKAVLLPDISGAAFARVGMRALSGRCDRRTDAVLLAAGEI
jgi:hypothetical protein